MPRKKELIVHVAGEVLRLTEGESRTVLLPITLRLFGGILYFTPPDVLRSDDKWVTPAKSVMDYYEETIVDPAQRVRTIEEEARGVSKCQ